MFSVCRHWTRRGLRILCYHGFSSVDEHRFRPMLFQTAERFRQRMTYLKTAGYRTLTLEEAQERLRSGKLAANDIVITIDDGFHGVHAIAAPILEELGLSATVYVTTYYVNNNNPVFRLALQYVFWKTACDKVSLRDWIEELPEVTPLKGTAGEQTLDKIMEYGETRLDEPRRMELLRSLAERLQVDFEELVQSRRLTLMNPTQIADLARRGFDIQLHTHRHRLPEDATEIRREIADNRIALQPLTSRKLQHFCYPSGVWSPGCWAGLAAMDVTTATTCDAGLNYMDTPPLALRRFLDFQNTPQVVFEADLAGFSDLLRKFRGAAVTHRD